jgi:hypothetical protein
MKVTLHSTTKIVELVFDNKDTMQPRGMRCAL